MLSFPVVRVLVIAAVAATDALVILVDAPTGRILLAVGQTVGSVLIYALVARAAAAREKRAIVTRLANAALDRSAREVAQLTADRPTVPPVPASVSLAGD